MAVWWCSTLPGLRSGLDQLSGEAVRCSLRTYGWSLRTYGWSLPPSGCLRQSAHSGKRILTHPPPPPPFCPLLRENLSVRSTGSAFRTSLPTTASREGDWPSYSTAWAQSIRQRSYRAGRTASREGKALENKKERRERMFVSESNPPGARRPYAFRVAEKPSGFGSNDGATTRKNEKNEGPCPLHFFATHTQVLLDTGCFRPLER